MIILVNYVIMIIGDFMKCPYCDKEYHGKTCPYCNDEYIPQEKEKEKASKKNIFLIVLSFLLAFISFGFPIFMIVAIISLIVSFYFIKEEKDHKKKMYFANSIVIILLISSFITYLNPYYEEYYGYKEIEKTLNIDLPDSKCDEYQYISGFENDNISYTYYKYELTLEEYNNIKNDEKKLEYQSDWYITIVSDLDSSFIIYDYIKEEYSYPKNKLDYRYMFIQLEENNGKYFAHIYKVEKRKY